MCIKSTEIIGTHILTSFDITEDHPELLESDRPPHQPTVQRLGTVQIFLIVLNFVFVSTNAIQYGVWKMEGLDEKFDAADNLLVALHGSLLMCGGSCSQLPLCVAFNYYAETRECQLLNTAFTVFSTGQMVTASGWKYYVQMDIRDPCASTPCPPDSACVRIEQPIWEKLDNALVLHACTRFQWLMDQTAAGKACTFKVLYKIDYPYADVRGWTNVPIPYYEMFGNCLTYNCAGVICVGTKPCWLKHNFELQTGSTVAHSLTLFWTPRCA
ncbi:uncharacterized protein [Penaeus vannamei]